MKKPYRIALIGVTALYSAVAATAEASKLSQWYDKNVKEHNVREAVKVLQKQEDPDSGKPAATPRPVAASSQDRQPAMAKVTKEEIRQYKQTYRNEITVLSSQAATLRDAKAAKEKAFAESERNSKERARIADEANARMIERGLKTVGKPLPQQAVSGAKQYLDFRKSYGAPYEQLDAEMKKVDGVYSTAAEDEQLKKVQKQIETRKALLKLMSDPAPKPSPKK